MSKNNSAIYLQFNGKSFLKLHFKELIWGLKSQPPQPG